MSMSSFNILISYANFLKHFTHFFFLFFPLANLILCSLYSSLSLPFICLSLYPSVYLFIYLSSYLSIYRSVCLLSAYLSVSLISSLSGSVPSSLSLFVLSLVTHHYVSFSFPISLCFYLPLIFCLCLYLFTSI